ncbi:hypothetical protein SPHINGOAX6_40162 [Sphingomonas sp. AX6]|nr:hypothetical protein SPHINGOAX6_40162 [Sphingomonas sp. AX6]
MRSSCSPRPACCLSRERRSWQDRRCGWPGVSAKGGRKMRNGLLLIGAVSLAACTSTPQPAPQQIASLPAITGDYFQMRSTATGHDYHIHVRLPVDYTKEPIASTRSSICSTATPCSRSWAAITCSFTMTTACPMRSSSASLTAGSARSTSGASISMPPMRA